MRSWYEAGVELETILRCFREKVSGSVLTDGSGRPIRTLRYFHGAVLDAHRLALRLRGSWGTQPRLPTPDPEERAPTIDSETWDGISARLEAAMDREEWETWFEKLDPQEDAGDRLVLQAPNEHFVHVLTQDDRLGTALVSAAQGTSVWVTDGWGEPREVCP